MPVHDWTLVHPEIWHAFFAGWICEIKKALNGGLLPDDYYALIEEQGGRFIAIRQVNGHRRLSDHRLVARVEIVSPANKDNVQHFVAFSAKVAAALDAGVHALVLDLFPRGSFGIKGPLVQSLINAGQDCDLPAEKPLTLVSYLAGPNVEIFLDPVAVGAELQDMPLFLNPGCSVGVPLESTYMSAYAGMPEYWKNVLEGRK